MSVVYFIQAGAGGPIKIGIAHNITRRIAALQTGCPDLLVVLATIAGGAEEEAKLHSHLRAYRVRGEWFRPAEEVIAAARLAATGCFPATVENAVSCFATSSPLGALVAAMRQQIARPGWSKERLAKLAGLHRNTLIGCEAATWNPTLATLLALEAAIARSEKAAAA